LLANPFNQNQVLKLALVAYRDFLTNKGNSPDYVKLTSSRIAKLFDACRFAVIADISEATVSTWLAEQRAQGMSLQTSNYYVVAIKGFCRWLLRDRRTGDNPLIHLSGMNSQTDRRVERRSLPDEEFARLVATTRQQPKYRDLNGSDRAILYLTAAYTGFRANELRSLTPASFDLNFDQSTVTVAAGYSKRRRKDTQPLRPDLAEALREYLVGKPASDPVWPGTWHKVAAKMIRADLKTAGIPYQDDAGRVFDFHALRHQFISGLAAAGVHPKTAQTLARHSTINLTMDRYTHVRLNDVAGALDGLPALPAKPVEAQPLKATGTDGELALRLAQKIDAACPAVSPNVTTPKVELLPNPNTGGTFGVKRRRRSSKGKLRPEGLEPPTDGLESLGQQSIILLTRPLS
jgi:integrase